MSEESKHNSKFQFISSTYIKEKYEKQGNKFTKVADDALIIAYKKDGQQLIRVIDNPDFTFRVAKPNVQLTTNVDNLPIENTDEVKIKYHDLNKVLAQIAGKEEAYFKLKSDRSVDFNVKRQFENMLQSNPRLFSSDISIEDQYKIKFVKEYGVNIGGYKKAVFDIETDGKGNGVIDPVAAKDPVNCISFYDFTTKVMSVFIWDQPERYPTFTKFKASVLDGSFERDILRKDPEMNGDFERRLMASDPKIAKDYATGKRKLFTNESITYDIRFFESEFELICAFYDNVHKCCPDFVLAWNFSFDNQTLINRLRRFEDIDHAFRTEDVVCDPDVPKQYRTVWFKEDRSNTAEYYNKWHWFTIPGRTTYLCSMAMYAHIRKSKGVLPSYSLDAICDKELKKGKLEYHDIATDVLELPYVDFTTFVKYNIRDTWLLAELENKHNDIDQIMYMAECTRLAQVTRLTTVIRNAQMMFYEDSNLAMGNNINAITDNPKVKYDGALVADPQLNEKILTPLFPRPIKTIRPYIADNDLTSMYPMMAISHNIYKTTLIFQIMKIGSTSIFQDSPSVFEISDCMDNYQCNQPTRWGHDYLQLPDVSHMVKKINASLGIN